MSARVEVYREDMTPGCYSYRWRFVKNGRVMADSGQGYSRRVDALNGCATVLGGWVTANDADGPCIRRAHAADDDFWWVDVLVVDLTRGGRP